MEPESIIVSARRRSPVLEAMPYNGPFELAFLRGSEQVGVATDGPGIVVLEDGKVKAKAAPGQWLIRDDDGAITVADEASFRKIYEVVVAGG